MGSSVILPTPGQPKQGPDPSFEQVSTPNLVTFGFDKVAPPTAIYIQRDDRLHVKLMNSVANTVFSLQARLLMPIGPLPGQPDNPPVPQSIVAQQLRGWIQTITQTFTPTSDRTANEFDVQLAEGYLLSVVLTVATFPGGLLRGQAYASVGLHRGGGPGLRFASLIEDCPAANVDTAWPSGMLRGSTEGPGAIRAITVANPAAGADFTLAVPNLTRWRIQSFKATLTTSAAVANRQVGVTVNDPAGQVWVTGAPANQTATLTVVYGGAGTSAPAAINTGVQNLVLPPDLVLTQGQTVAAGTANLQAADQWSAITFLVEEWVMT